jgi:hypothetical protein
MPDDLTSTLADIRERQALASDASLGFSRMEERHAALIKVAYEDVPLLLAAVEAALKEADEWDAEARGIFLEAARTADAGEVGAASALQSAAADLRAAITAALGGTQQSEDAGHG